MRKFLLARTPGKAGKLAKYCLELHCENRDFMSAEICSILNTQILNATVISFWPGRQFGIAVTLRT